jgi:hypothetical protein
MIAWILSIWANPLARKIIIYAGVIAAICYGLRLWGNRQWQKGETAGRQFVAAQLEKQKQVEWAAKEKAISAAAANITTEKQALVAAASQLAQDRATINLSLKSALAAATARKEANYATVANIRASDLDAAIRSVSAELAAAQ